MRQNLGILLTVVLLLGVLIAINSATYLGNEEPRDSELSPNRSSYHSGPTGSRALYDFLSESGYKVIRWREIPGRLLSDNRQKVQTFVIIGSTPLSIDDDQAKSLMLWVENGGRLVLVDRQPPVSVLGRSGEWAVSTELGEFPVSVDPGNSNEMTENVTPAHPVQPTLLTHHVEVVMPSRFAATVKLSTVKKEKTLDKDAENESETGEGFEDAAPLEPEPIANAPITDVSTTPASPAPVTHLSNSRGPLLLDYTHGKGRIVLLSDPYIFSNGGISLRDNLRLAVNILAGDGGLIAFDEYHQGRGTTRNAWVGYFAGTPVLAMAGQIVLLILVVLWTRSRRFARPLPLEQVDRRSTLEFVASMSELQQRARAYDLAIENIYLRTRRVLARYAGVEYKRPRAEIASRVAARSALDAHSLETLMRQCEEAINGEPVTERQSIDLARRLREVESTLGLRMRSRDAKQATQKI